MINSWLTNLFIGVFGFLLAFLLSLKTNPIGTSFIRGLLALLLFYLLGYAVKWVINFVLTDTTNIDLTSENQSLDKNNLENNPHVLGKQQSTSQASTDAPNEKQGPTFEGDVYEKTSQFVRDLLNEND